MTSLEDACLPTPLLETSKQHLIPNDQLCFLPPLPDTPWLDRAHHMPSSFSSYASPQTISYPSHAVQLNDTTDQEQARDAGSIRRSESTHMLSGNYPVLSTRQSGTNTPRNPSPVKTVLSSSRSDNLPQNGRFSSINPAHIPLPGSPAKHDRHLSPYKPRVVSTSFNMLSPGDASLIGDCRPPSSLGHFEDSFDFHIEQIRPLTGRRARISLAPAKDSDESLESPTRPVRRLLAESTLLPNSPRLDLMGSTNALSRVDPPWKTETSPTRASVPRSVSKNKRTFPASSSGQSLASVGEERENYFASDASTLLPVSPAKMRHLLQPHHMLQNEDISLLGVDGPSLFLPRSTDTVSASRQQPRQAVRGSSHSPVKLADVTLDLKDVMAGMNKPKRASGGEMSFMDLLHGQHDLIAVEELDAEENFVPLNLRPARHLVGGTHTAPRIRQNVLPGDLASPSTARTSRRRSKSLSETVQEQVPLTMRHTPAKGIIDKVSTPKQRVGMMPMSSKRISLSVGAVPMPSNASHKTMLLPRVGASRLSAAPTTKRPSAQPSVALPKPRSGSAVALSATLGVPVVAQQLRPAMRPPTLASRSAAPLAKPGPVSRPTATISSRTSSKTVSASTQASGSSQLIRTSTRSMGLPQPGTDTTARSALLPARATREFGGDVASKLNGTSRMIPPSRTTNLGKISSSSAIPSRSIAVPATSRAMSTPASRIVGTKMMETRKASMPPGRSTVIPRPISRVPTSSTSIGPESKGGKATMEDIRARLQRLQTRQGVQR